MLDYIDDNSETSKLLANVAATVNLTDWLAYKINYGYENSDAVRRVGVSPHLGFPDIESTNGRVVIDNLYAIPQLLEHTLYFRQGALGVEIDLLVGFSYQRFERRGGWLEFFCFVIVC